jgi:hypothetical protein
MATFSAAPGQVFDRNEIHALHGGRIHSRISTVKDADYVFLFVDPLVEERAGLPCGLGPDGLFHVAGEGLSGDQKIKNGNLILSRHRETGKTLHVFVQKSKALCSYVGVFETDMENPLYRTDLPGAAEGEIRDGLVFRLSPVGQVSSIPRSSLVASPEQSPRLGSAEHLMHTPNGKGADEVDLLTASFLGWKAMSGERLVTLSVVPEDEYREISPVLFDPGSSHAYCVCPSTSRARVREAIGQALDIKRLADCEDVSLVFPSEPRPDVVALIEYSGVSFGWRDGNDWVLGQSHSPSYPASTVPRP